MSKSYKLTDDTRAIVQQRIDSAKEAHRQAVALSETDYDYAAFPDSHERNQAMNDGRYWDIQHNRPDELMQINHVAPCIGAKQAIVTGGETVFTLHGRRQQYENIADDVNALLTSQWQSKSFDDVCNAARYDASVHGFGVVEIGWKIDWQNTVEYGSRPQALIDSENSKVAPTPDLALPESSEGSLSLATDQAGEIAYPSNLALPDSEMFMDEMPEVPEEEPIYDDPFIERFSPADFFVDPGHTMPNLSDARYAFRRKDARLNDVRNNKAYRNNKDLKGEVRKGKYAGTSDSAVQVVADDILTVEIFDGYMFLDRNNDGVEEFLHIIFCTETGKELLCESTPYPHFAKTGNPYPFEVYVNERTNMDSGIYGNSDVTAVADIQRAHDLAYTMIEYQRSHSPKIYKCLASFLESDEGQVFKQSVESNVENIVVGFTADALGSSGWEVNPAVHQDAYQALASTRPHMLERIGITEYQGNSSSATKRTAYEVNTIAQQGQTRQGTFVQEFSKFIARLAYKVLILDQQFIERAREYVSVDATGARQFGDVTVEQLRNGVEKPGVEKPEGLVNFEKLLEPGIQFAVSVDPSKQSPPNPDQEMQNTLKLIGAIGPMMNIPDPMRQGETIIDPRMLLQSLVSKFPLANVSKIVRDEPTGEEEQSLVEHWKGIAMKAVQQLQMITQQMQGGGQPPQEMPPPPDGAPMQPGGMQ